MYCKGYFMTLIRTLNKSNSSGVKTRQTKVSTPVGALVIFSKFNFA